MSIKTSSPKRIFMVVNILAKFDVVIGGKYENVNGRKMTAEIFYLIGAIVNNGFHFAAMKFQSEHHSYY